MIQHWPQYQTTAIFSADTHTRQHIDTCVQVVTGRGESGIIEGSFGKSGKLRVNFPAGISPAGPSNEDNTVLLYCKRYIHDTDRKRLKQ